MVDAEPMQRNLDSTRGLVFSGQLLLDLAAAGMLREEAYLWCSDMRWKRGKTKPISERLSDRSGCQALFIRRTIGRSFSLQRQLEKCRRDFPQGFRK